MIHEIEALINKDVGAIIMRIKRILNQPLFLKKVNGRAVNINLYNFKVSKTLLICD